MKTIGLFVKENRKKMGWTQQQLAEKMELSRPFVLEIEVGRKVFSSDKLKKLAEVLNLSEEEKNLMYDLAAKFRNDIPEDIREFLLEHTELYKDIRNKMKEV